MSITKKTYSNNKIDSLPGYLAWNETTAINNKLRTKTLEMSFPLSKEDKRDIDILEMKFDQEESCSGLAAPQIGISKKFIVFQVLDKPKLKKWRPDLTQTMAKVIWLNPSFEPIGVEKNVDVEACFSVQGLAGYVSRYKKIKYKAFDIHGNLIEGAAEGFLARVIQHEIDHLNGKLFIDNLNKEDLIYIEEYREMRKKTIKALQKEEL